MRLQLERPSQRIRLYLLAALVSAELLMSFSFLGYFHVEPISITIAYIPVLLAGALMGPAEAALLGAVFGLASMWKASASYVMVFDQLFSPVMSGYPLKSFLLSVGSRALFGLLVGLLYYWARKGRRPGIWLGVISFFGPSIHSALVYSALWAFFPETGYTPMQTLHSLGTSSGVITGAAAACLVCLAWRLVHSHMWNQFLAQVEAARTFRYMEQRGHGLPVVCIVLLAIISSVAVAIYFVSRMERVLEQQGIALTESEYTDLFHLQIQFLIGILSIMGLVTVFLIFNRLYTAYIGRDARTDALTGALNRKAFFQTCGRALRDFCPDGEKQNYFIMVDIDHFKEINDQHGHPEGDRALKEIVLELEATFGRDGFVGRVGGDEFAVFLVVPLSREELERELRRFQERLHGIRWGERAMSCSIGAQPAAPGRTAEDLYRAADDLLYLAKKHGKDQYVIGPAGDQTTSP